MPIFRVNDCQGYSVTLEEERWEHIIEGHPEIKPLQELLKRTAEDPELIKRDPERNETHYYYRMAGIRLLRKDDLLMSAVVERSEANKVAHIRTAHLVRGPKKQGEVVWFKLQTSSR